MKTADPAHTISQTLRDAATALSCRPDLLPRLEAETLLAFSLNRPRTHLIAWSDQTLTPEQLYSFQKLLNRRLQGEPHAYLTGLKEFWSLSLKVTPDTLIPRPETELLVERALALFPDIHGLNIADLGTGCGAIAAALASERPNWQVQAVDASSAALAVARENFASLGLRNVFCSLGDWCEALPGSSSYSLIVSNPPYICTDDPHLHQGGLPWEPAAALVSGKDGLDDIRQIIDQAFEHLTPGGWLLLEHGHDQGKRVRGMLERQGYGACRTLRDLNHNQRLSEGRRPM